MVVSVSFTYSSYNKSSEISVTQTTIFKFLTILGYLGGSADLAWVHSGGYRQLVTWSGQDFLTWPVLHIPRS